MSEIKKNPKPRDKSKKRQAILDGAIDVFIEDGYELASMDKVAEVAGVSKRTVYNHFGSKENLFETIIDDFLAQRQTLKTIQYDSNQSIKDQLIAFAKAEFFLIDTPKRVGLSRAMTTTFLTNMDYAIQTVGKYPSPHINFASWLEAAQADGKIKMANAMLTARMFYAMVEGALTWPSLFTNGLNRDMAAPVLDEIIEVFLARYGAEEKGC